MPNRAGGADAAAAESIDTPVTTGATQAAPTPIAAARNAVRRLGLGSSLWLMVPPISRRAIPRVSRVPLLSCGLAILTRVGH